MPFAATRQLLAKMTQYNITVTSDIVCPWCMIGHSRLSRAIADHKKQYPDDKFNLKYLPFYLQPPPQQTSRGPAPPPFPAPSQPRREMYIQKFGPERAKQIEAMMTQTAKGEGLNFKYGGNTGPSRNGHRLVHWAQGKGGEHSQNEVMMGLWRRYFEQEVDITTLETLVDVGLEAKLGTKEEITEYLTSGKDGEWVDKVADEAHMKGISGVPFYEINDTWEVSGAQDPLAFKKLFSRWKELEAKGQVPSIGASSTRGDECL
jgi:predicted DsbA family dithiol-disulfide isomerase